MKDFLKQKNCNKTHCKSCIFHPNEDQRIPLSNERKREILTYLAKFESSHICHQTNLTCYGALEFQAGLMFRLGLISENTVDCMLETANDILKLE